MHGNECSSGFMHLAAGLSVGLTGLAAGYAIGIVGDMVCSHLTAYVSATVELTMRRGCGPICSSRGYLLAWF